MSDEAKREQEFTDAPLYEIEGAIRGAVTDVIVACGNWSERRQREQTAATILAALLTRNEATQGECVETAVALADALRDEMERKP